MDMINDTQPLTEDTITPGLFLINPRTEQPAFVMSYADYKDNGGTADDPVYLVGRPTPFNGVGVRWVTRSALIEYYRQCEPADLYCDKSDALRILLSKMAGSLGERHIVMEVMNKRVEEAEHRAANPESLAEYKARVWTTAIAAKRSEGWCDSGFDRAMRELDITEPALPTYTVTVTVTPTRDRLSRANDYHGDTFAERVAAAAIRSGDYEISEVVIDNPEESAPVLAAFDRD